MHFTEEWVQVRVEMGTEVKEWIWTFQDPGGINKGETEVVTGVEQMKHLWSYGPLRRNKRIRVEKIIIRAEIIKKMCVAFLESEEGWRKHIGWRKIRVWQKWPELQKKRGCFFVVGQWLGNENWGSGVFLSEGWEGKSDVQCPLRWVLRRGLVGKDGGVKKQAYSGLGFWGDSFVGSCWVKWSGEHGVNLGKNELSGIGSEGRVGLFGGLLETNTLEGKGDGN